MHTPVGYDVIRIHFPPRRFASSINSQLRSKTGRRRLAFRAAGVAVPSRRVGLRAEV